MAQNKVTKLLVIIFLLLPIQKILSQVTIGSANPPARGALLDLKEKESTDASRTTSQRGLSLPRVKLVDLEKLIMSGVEITDAQDGGDQYAAHTGLVVYNVSGEPIPQCAPIPDGVYIWDGNTWQAININTGETESSTITLSQGNIDFPSGQDLRPMPTGPEVLTVSWSPVDNPNTYTNTPHATWGGISFNAANTPPSSGTLTTSPTSFNLLPNAMTPADVAENPFRTKQNTLTFTVPNECGATDITEVRVITQTNKALTLQTPVKEVTASSSETNIIKSNGQWKLKSILPNDGTNAITLNTLKLDGTQLSIGSTQGEEKNDNTSKDGNLTYNVTVDATKSRYNFLTFEDASPIKRFADITLTVLQCKGEGSMFTIDEWALIAGFTQTEIDAVKNTGNSSRKLTNGLQMHRVKDTPRGTNQIFLSSNFGTDPQGDDERWMIHNLDAKSYDMVTNPYSTLTGPNANNSAQEPSFSAAYWAYPNEIGHTIEVNNDAGERLFYDKNQRLGLLYSWAAATAGKGGANGKGNAISEAGKQHTPVQGICPAGWHLPSDYEWTVLENRFISNPGDFSSTPTPNNPPTLLDPTSPRNDIYRGTHGLSMKEICEPHTPITEQGTSNGIRPTARPGFDVLFAGYASNGGTNYYNTFGFFWLSSSDSLGDYAFYRSLDISNPNVFRGVMARHTLISVRCKKDN